MKLARSHFELIAIYYGWKFGFGAVSWGLWVGEIKIFGLKSARTVTSVAGCPSGLWRAT